MLVQGMEELERKFGFQPQFHDDYVESIIVTSDRIEIVIQTVDGPGRLQKRNGARFKLTCQDISEFYFKGKMYGIVSIISELLFLERPEGVEVRLATSLGAEGVVWAKEVKIQEINDDNNIFC